MMTSHNFARTTAVLVSLLLSGCGGGGSGTAAAPVVQTPPPSSTPGPVVLKSGLELGVGAWPDGSTASGGNGSTISGVECLKTEDYHIHSHLTIIKNGQVQGLPANIGLQGCAYELHTHDHSGIIHVETSTVRKFTLGQFFAVWGQPLDAANVAGMTGLPVAAYVTDGAAPVSYTGKLADIELAARREITIVIGSAPAQLPTYQWDSSL